MQALMSICPRKFAQCREYFDISIKEIYYVNLNERWYREVSLKDEVSKEVRMIQ